MNQTEQTGKHHTFTAQEVERDAKERLSVITKEFSEGFAFIQKYKKSVTFFGSAVIKESNTHYQQARRLSGLLVGEGYSIVTGGGPGIMEAANRGAFEAGGKSVGLNIVLPNEQKPNPYLTDYYEFYYFFSRKVALSFAAEAYLFFPGGYGTLNGLFEIMTLVQTRRITRVPIILCGSDFWKPLDSFIKETILTTHHAISEHDRTLYQICDNDQQIVEIIKRAPIIDSVPFNGNGVSRHES